MEMNDPVLLQVIATQTNILEEIKNLRQREEMRNVSVTPKGNDMVVSPNSQIDMFQPSMYETVTPDAPAPFNAQRYYDTMTPATIPVTGGSSMVSPTSYNNLSKTSIFDVGGIANSTLSDVMNFDPSRMSKQAREEMIAQRSQALQLGTVNTMASGGSLIGSGAGMLMGGLLPSLAVGAAVGGGIAFVGNSMVDGAQASIRYQDILRRDGYKAFNAFESTSRYGGIGMNLQDQQDISGYLRDLANETYLTNDEMATVLQGSLDNKLLKSVKDADQFKDRMKTLVDSVKQVSILLDETLEESVNFLGEMERRGIGSKEGLRLASNIKVGASMLGMDAAKYSDMVFQQTDAITSGTAMDNADVIKGISSNAFIVEAISDVSKQGNEQLYNYIKNNGGAGAVAGNIEAQLRNSLQGNDAVQRQLLAFISPAMVKDGEGFTVDQAKLNDILNSGKSIRSLMDESAAYTSNMSAGDLSVLAGSVGNVANTNLSSAQMMQVYKLIQDSFAKEFGVSNADALIKMGVASDFNNAELLNQSLIAGTDEDVQRQINSKAFKELTDTDQIADSPGLKKSMKFWWRRNVTGMFEDAGANISDSIGSISEDLQMWSKGIEETGIVGGNIVSDFSQETMDNFFYGEDSYLNSFYKNMREFDSYQSTYDPKKSAKENLAASLSDNTWGQRTISNLQLSGMEALEKPDSNKVIGAMAGGEFSALSDAVKNGEVSASQLQEFQNMLNSDNVRGSAKEQYQYLLDLASGELDGEGFFGKIGAWSRRNGAYIGAYMNADFLRDFKIGGSDSKQLNSLELIEKEEKKLTSEGKKLQQELNKVLLKSNLDPESIDQVQQAITSGDTESISHIYLDSDLKDVRDRYSEYNRKIANMSEAKDQYFAVQGTTTTYGKATEGAYAFLKNSGIYSDVEFNSYFKDSYEDIKKIVDKMPEMDDKELAKAYEDIKTQSERTFNNLSTARKEQLADSLMQSGIIDNVSNLYKENSNQIDANKLLAVLQNEGRYAMSGENAAETVLTDGKVTTAMEDHKAALGTLTDGLVEEVGILSEAVVKLQRNQNKRNITSTSN